MEKTEPPRERRKRPSPQKKPPSRANTHITTAPLPSHAPPPAHRRTRSLEVPSLRHKGPTTIPIIQHSNPLRKHQQPSLTIPETTLIYPTTTLQISLCLVPKIHAHHLPAPGTAMATPTTGHLPTLSTLRHRTGLLPLPLSATKVCTMFLACVYSSYG